MDSHRASFAQTFTITSYRFILLFLSLFLVINPQFWLALSRPFNTALTNTVSKIAAPKVNFSQVPLAFEENHGQTDSAVKFLTRGKGYNLYLTQTGATFQLAKNNETSSVIQMELIGSHTNAVIHGIEELPSSANYFTGKDQSKWTSNVNMYEKIQYQGVYPGIDLVYYGNQGQLEYDFVVQPGANPADIEFSFSGADKIESTNEGNLLIHSQGGVITLNKPILYQVIQNVRQDILGNFTLHDNDTVAFNVGSYDPKYELVIDPVLVYSTYLGGSYNDFGTDIAVDSNGSTYVVGWTESLNFPTVNSFQSSPNGNNDIFISKLNETGDALVYSTYVGSPGNDKAFGLTVDGSGSVYVTGATSSTSFPTTAGAFQTTYNGNQWDAFVLKLNPAGNQLVYSTYLGSSGTDYGQAIAVDSAGEAYVGGFTGSFTGSPNFPIQNALYPTYGGPSGSGYNDGFLTKINADGAGIIFSTYLGGNGGGDIVLDIALDSSGNVYASGSTDSTNFPVVNAYQPANAGGLCGTTICNDAFVTKITSDGSTAFYSTYLGGSGDEIRPHLAVDTNDNVYLGGETTSSNFPRVNPYQNTRGGSRDAFLTKFTSSGNSLEYSTYLGGNNSDGAQDVSVDGSGQAYLAGYTYSSNFPLMNSLQNRNGAQPDAFVTRFASSGQVLNYSTLLGGSDVEQDIRMTTDSLQNAYVTGYTVSSDFPTLNAYDSTGDAVDAFVTKISPLNPNQPPTVSANGPYQVNESATVQLSATGNDPENGVLSYAWDLDNNGSFETAGQNVNFSAVTLDPGIYTVVVQVTDVGNLTATDTTTVTVNDIPTADDFILLGKEGVWLKSGVSVTSGNVGADIASGGPFLDSGVEVSIGNNVSIINVESAVFGDSIKLKAGSQVESIYYNDVSGTGTVLGSQFTPFTVPFIPAFPAVPSFSAGTTDITIPANASQVLAAGDYKDLLVNHDAILTLSGGVYNFASWDVRDDAKIYFSAASEVRVADKLGTNGHVFVQPALGSGINASDIKIIVTGINGGSGNIGATPKAAEFGQFNTVEANVYSPNGTLWFRDNASAKGAFIGKWVIAGQNSELIYDSAF